MNCLHCVNRCRSTQLYRMSVQFTGGNEKFYLTVEYCLLNVSHCASVSEKLHYIPGLASLYRKDRAGHGISSPSIT
jgi:hypothetical protein